MDLKDTYIIILAGGLGTRLKAVVGNTPKPIALIHENPFLCLLIDSLYAQGIRKIILSL
ncbi:MAG: sugar phosphate nucleotidyltransferase, partial [Pseudobdellovibrionaceae bacterium]